MSGARGRGRPRKVPARPPTNDDPTAVPSASRRLKRRRADSTNGASSGDILRVLWSARPSALRRALSKLEPGVTRLTADQFARGIEEIRRRDEGFATPGYASSESSESSSSSRDLDDSAFGELARDLLAPVEAAGPASERAACLRAARFSLNAAGVHVRFLCHPKLRPIPHPVDFPRRWDAEQYFQSRCASMR